MLALAARLASGCTACWLIAQPAAAQEAPEPPAAPASAPTPAPAPALSLKNTGPIEIEAESLQGLPGKNMEASGQVRVRRGPLRLGADHVQVDVDQDLLRATGHVELERSGDLYTGSVLELNTSEYTGFLLTPTYHLARTQAGGKAARINFLGPNKVSAQNVSYTSCTVADADTPPWELSATRLRADIEANEGLAEGAVLRFYGVPILAAPVLSFPVTDERKSGWLPLQLGGASNNGLDLAVPYYWNIAPNRDLTLTPTLSSRRGAGMQAELRYLEPGFRGEASTYLLPGDKVAGRDRWALRLNHEASWRNQWFFDTKILRVSDDNYWNDGLRGATNLTPRLLPSTAQLQGLSLLRLGDNFEAAQTLYARAERYQALQGNDPTARFVAPYRREPQVGASWRGLGSAVDWRLETEINHFTNEDSSKQTGTRLHSRASVAWPLGNEGWRLTPRVFFNAAAYSLDQPMSDGRTSASRFIPSASLDSQWFFDRPIEGFGRALTQTLEPRLLYVHTPYRAQDQLPNFDSAELDFNDISIFADNAFSGVDRVSDAHQVTAGVTTRFIDRNNGAELARLGIAQRYLLRDQQITPDGVPLTSSVSDVLLYGASSAIEKWKFQGTLQYNPDTERVVRTIATSSYSPGPFRVISAGYRLQRDSLLRAGSELLTLGWQWPLWSVSRNATGRGAGADSPATEAVQASDSLRLAGKGGRDCRGTFYGVGRMEYSLREQRVSASILGVEYDAGCWIGRFVVERTSTSLNTATTKWWLQLELVGLSRLGSNPLSTLRDNIPGYRLLNDRQSRSDSAGSTPYSDGQDAPRY